MIMINFILQISLISGSIGTVVIILSKISELAQLPEITEEEKVFIKALKGRFKKIDFGKIKILFMNRFSKFLHQIRLWSLKTDNLASRWIKKMKEETHKISSVGWMRGARFIPTQPRPENYFGRLLDSVNSENNSFDLLNNGSKEGLDKEKQLVDMIIKNPRDTKTYKNLGLLYYERKNYNDARESFKMALKFGSKDKTVQKLMRDLEEKELQIKEA